MSLQNRKIDILSQQIGLNKLCTSAKSKKKFKISKQTKQIKLGINNEQFLDTKRKTIKPETKSSQICLVIYEIMIKLCEYFEYDLIAKIKFSKEFNFENIEFYSKMPKIKKTYENENENGYEYENCTNNKIIFFPDEEENEINSKIIQNGEVENISKNKLNNSKSKDKIDHNYGKITPQDEDKNNQLEELSFTAKKKEKSEKSDKSDKSEKSTNQSSLKNSLSNNEVLTKLSAYK